MLHQVCEFRVRPGHRIWVRLTDGIEGTVDLSALVGRGIFAPLADEGFFASVAIDEFGAICWPNGADLAPDAMHSALQRQGSWQPVLTPAPQTA